MEEKSSRERISSGTMLAAARRSRNSPSKDAALDTTARKACHCRLALRASDSVSSSS